MLCMCPCRNIDPIMAVPTRWSADPRRSHVASWNKDITSVLTQPPIYWGRVSLIIRVSVLWHDASDTLVKRVYGAWEHVYLPVLSFSIHIEQRHVNITVLFNFWFKTVNNCDTYCVDNLNIPPIMFFVPNITFSGVRIFTRNIYLHCTDISDTGVQMFLRTNDKNNSIKFYKYLKRW